VLRFLVRYPLSRRNYTLDYAAHSVSKVAICSKALAIRMKYDTVRPRDPIKTVIIFKIHYFSVSNDDIHMYLCKYNYVTIMDTSISVEEKGGFVQGQLWTLEKITVFLAITNCNFWNNNTVTDNRQVITAAIVIVNII